jgi:hypothetical protein
MRNLWFLLMLLVMLIACSPLSRVPDPTPLPTQEPTSTPIHTPAPRLIDGIMLTDSQEVVDKMKALCCKDGWWEHLSDAEHKSNEVKNNGGELDIGTAFLESLEASGERFEANEYFTVLTHLALEDGYVLDYVYYAPGSFGAPYLYAQREGEPALGNYSEYQETNVENFLNHIQVDGTAEGYYELAVMSIMGAQFYLSWHAEYNDWEVVSSRERQEAIIEFLNEKYHPLTEEQVESILQLDVTPRLKFEGDKVRVQILIFTKWGGFYEREYTIDRDFPHQMIYEDIELVPYNCGIVF